MEWQTLATIFDFICPLFGSCLDLEHLNLGFMFAISEARVVVFILLNKWIIDAWFIPLAGKMWYKNGYEWEEQGVYEFI